VLCDLNLNGCNQVSGDCEMAAKANGKSVKLHTMRCNAGVEGDVITVISHTELTYGPIDFFVANAGILMANPTRRPFVGLETTDAEWKTINDVNFMQVGIRGIAVRIFK
jgi:NAD(P)-dependent dehydrogenase (short-subunit alcohol dehydrogenase family)